MVRALVHVGLRGDSGTPSRAGAAEHEAGHALTVHAGRLFTGPAPWTARTPRRSYGRCGTRGATAAVGDRAARSAGWVWSCDPAERANGDYSPSRSYT